MRRRKDMTQGWEFWDICLERKKNERKKSLQHWVLEFGHPT